MRILIILRSKSQTVPTAKPLLTHSFNCGFSVSREKAEQIESGEQRAERVCGVQSRERESGELREQRTKPQPTVKTVGQTQLYQQQNPS
jgi:hypothetical protein